DELLYLSTGLPDPAPETGHQFGLKPQTNSLGRPINDLSGFSKDNRLSGALSAMSPSPKVERLEVSTSPSEIACVVFKDALL
ncbi:hypothetical protein V5O48_009792, partial [Marasmius crinis-equi]